MGDVINMADWYSEEPSTLMVEHIDNAVQVEQALIGKLVWPDSPTREPPDLDPSDMVHPLHGEILQAVIDIRRAGEISTALAVHARLNGGEEYRKLGGSRYLVRCTDLCVVDREADLVDLVREQSRKRRLSVLARNLQEQALLAGNGSLDTIAEFERELDALKSTARAQCRTLEDVAADIVEGLRQERSCHSTGLPRLDDAMGGGVYPGKLYGFAGKHKSGKSMMLATIALNLAKTGVPVCYVALEMGEEQLAQRMLARELGFNSIGFLHDDREILAKRIERHSSPAARTMRFVDRPGMSWDALRNCLSEHATRHGSQVFVVDYWQLVGGRERNQSKTEHLERVADWLADFAKNHSVVVLTAGQLNRSGEMRDSDGLHNACSMLFKIHRVDLHDTKQIWLEMLDSRYTEALDVGSEEYPPMYISTRGPAIEEWGQA